jgi:hypothetical protein
MSKTRNLRPGAKVPRSGQYQQTGPRGGQGKEVTSVKGERLPPAPKKGTTYKLVDATKNKSGRGR